MWFFSWFKHDPSKDEIAKANKESLKLAEQEEEEMRRLEKSKKKGKTKQVDDGDHVEDKGQVKPSKDHVEKEDLNPLPSICYGCNSAIEDGIHVDAFDVLWHPLCLICLHCQQPIAKKEISNSKGQYHRPCYHKCYVCEKKIEKGIKYNRHPFWKEKYCPGHDDDGTAKCCSCERLESFGTKYVNLEDGRWLCRECMECAVMDTAECQNLHSEILEFFEGLNMKIKKKFPLLLVEKEALNKAEKEEKIDHQSEVITRGICLSEEQIVTSVSKLPKEVVNNRLIGMARESQRVVRECEVTAILILYGLPRFLTGYILAHEMMHAWLRLNDYRNLNTVLEEGLCQVLGHMWLEPQTYATLDVVAAAETADASSSSSPSRTPPATSKKCDPSVFEKKLVEFCKHQIETDDSAIYGLGFKKVSRMMKSNNYSLKDTLKDIVSASKTIPDSKF